MNKLPDVSRGTFSSVGSDKQKAIFKFPLDGLPPALLYFRNVGILGSIFLKMGTDAETDTVSSDDFQYVFLPGEEKYLDNPGTGWVIVISDQADGVPYSFNARYTTAGVAAGANVS